MPLRHLVRTIKLLAAVKFRLLFERPAVPVSHGLNENHDEEEIKINWIC
jgi:hypothetical protein